MVSDKGYFEAGPSVFGLSKMKLSKKRCVVFLGIAVCCVLVIVLALFNAQTPTLYIEVPRIVVTSGSRLGGEYYRWVVIPKIIGTADEEDFSLVGSGRVDVKLPTGAIVNLSGTLILSQELLKQLNQPPLLVPDSPGLCIIAERVSTAPSIDIEQCQLRVTLDARDYRKGPRRPVMVFASKLGVWIPARGWLTDRLINRLAGIAPYTISSEWSQSSVTDYELGDTL